MLLERRNDQSVVPPLLSPAAQGRAARTYHSSDLNNQDLGSFPSLTGIKGNSLTCPEPSRVGGQPFCSGQVRLIIISAERLGKMSIHMMIALHHDVGDNFNEALATVARHAMFCSSMCISCADACSAEKMDMRQCIRTCLDCSDVCDAAGRLSMRRTGQNIAVVRTMLETCIQACEYCAEECERHKHGHCKLCAEMCRECAKDCKKALPTIQ